MRLTDLSLNDFRSHKQVLLRLQPGVTTFLGGNGQGKTNLVEAVAYLATLSSHRAATSAPLVARGADSARVRGKLVRDERSVVVDVEITPGKALKAWLGKNKVKPAELYGVLRAVVFAPEDLALVRGGPEVRRRYLDELLVQLRPSLAGVIADYDKVHHQRTALLKSLTGLVRSQAEVAGEALDVWDERAAELGGRLTAERMAVTAQLAPQAANAYARLAGIDAPEGETGTGEGDGLGLGMVYRPTVELEGRPGPAVVAEEQLKAMRTSRLKEIERGAALVGPHREDVELAVGGLPARTYTSHGEAWTAALALKMAAFELIRRDCQDDPILILDDVFAELDGPRRQSVADLVADAEQVLVTAAVASDVPEGITAHWFVVADGKVVAGGEPADD